MQESRTGLTDGGRHLIKWWRHAMSVPDNAMKMAEGNRVPWERLLLKHLSLSCACPQLWHRPPAQGSQAPGTAVPRPWSVGVKRSTETKLVTMCRTWWVWHYLKQMSLDLVSGGWVGKQHQDWAQQAWPSPVEVDLYCWSLHQNVHLGQLFRNWDESHYQC